MPEFADEPNYEVHEEAWGFFESSLGFSISVVEFLARVGVPSHCDFVIVWPSGAREIVVFAHSTETGLNVTLAIGEETNPRDANASRRYCELRGVWRNTSLKDPREVGFSKSLVDKLVDFFGRNGYSCIKAVCNRDVAAGHYGHYVWARHGFNGFVPEYLVERAVAELGLSRDRRPTLECVFRRLDGPSWCKQRGETYHGRIKLLESSRSYRFFQRQRGVL